MAVQPLKVLFFVEGNTDIRFVVGLSELSELTMMVPAGPYAESGLKERVAKSGARVEVEEIPGGRLTFQARSLERLWRRARGFDVILAQEVLRGALNANLVGRALGIPVVTYMGISPLEYFRCRRERGQIGLPKSLAGEALIRTLMAVNGRLATRCLAMGPYLVELTKGFSSRGVNGLYYGVDVDTFRPADARERRELRRKRDLPEDKFIAFFSSRVSHEKDPETVLEAVHRLRQRGVDAVALNLGGGWREFLALAKSMGLPETERWVLGRPAAHPMTEVADYFRASDVTAQASLAEGCGLSPLESLACGTPVVATAVGGMAALLPGLARLTPRRDPEAMARELVWIHEHPEEARAQALQGREYVVREWSRQKAFSDLERVLREASGQA